MFLYVFFSLIGILAAFLVSRALDIPKPNKQKCWDIYIAAAIGIIVGSKLPVWISYGFSTDLILSGKSVLGGILGAFVALNIYKYLSHQQGEALGGRFAIPLAVAVGFGKIGCWFHGCCGGDFILPPQLVESGFQFTLAGALYIFYQRTKRIDLLFPLYLLAYLIMRFAIEFVRTEPKVLWDMTIYQYLALLFVPIIMALLYERRKTYV